ncbi:hypothetical protein Poli38472_013644 [Pythium oligandrum]|uniref:FYVE-type domain-containing protein n=1 Tax=Pythium oligandrum TaxID=41045 RepID=A0A8K1CE37_PYTOL|nr:hypothetical protein Poli38472_013644 [Pythium oligandrum]|eukprot:TMW61181.1 hypothetical protein Poli38472_013644 [Pythium oligandrum]
MTSIRQVSGTEGLEVQDNTSGTKTLVLSSQELTNNVLATLPKLQAAVEQAKTKVGQEWKLRPENDVQLYEWVRESGKDTDVTYALLATTELKCHVNEVLNVLIHHDSEGLDATTQALGSEVRGGAIHYQQLHPLQSEVVADAPQSALFTVKTVEVEPKSSNSKHQLGFSTATIRFPTRDRAYHLMKTLPKNVHGKVVMDSKSVVLNSEDDHLVTGWDIQSTSGDAYGSGNQTTRVTVHSYTSSANPEAELVLQALTKSLRELETVIRRRRLGFQTFVVQSKDNAKCSACHKEVSPSTQDEFCRLCGHVTCDDCSNVHDVEAPVGQVHKNRFCAPCVRRVDGCHFDDEDLVPALGPVVVDTLEDEWESSVASLCDGLLLEEPSETSKALETLDQLLQVESSSGAKPTKAEVAQSLEQHLAKNLKTAKETFRADECQVYGKERDYAFEYDANTMSHSDIPLAPASNAEKDARRLHYMETTGILKEDYDRSALDLLAQRAAKQLGCPIGFIGTVSETHFEALGNYKLALPGKLTRDENLCTHTIHAERPMILKNPQRDVRFAQLPVMKGGVKFYAGFPVRAPDGTVLGSLCAIDVKPHDNIETKDYATMQMLSELAAELIVPKKQEK